GSTAILTNLIPPRPLETRLTEPGNHQLTHEEEKKPSQPSLLLLEQTEQVVGLAEAAALGYALVLARTPTTYLSARGSLNSALPPPRCRARYRKSWNEGRKYKRNRRVQIQLK
ncbi:E4 protein, partial [Okapia johnstoni papillomavirus 1]